MSTYKVIYSFEGREKDMLSVKSGDIITVLKSSGNGWCTVRSSTGKQGLVPSSYIEAVSNIVSVEYEHRLYSLCLIRKKKQL